jgi:hypothetical protein
MMNVCDGFGPATGTAFPGFTKIVNVSNPGCVSVIDICTLVSPPGGKGFVDCPLKDLPSGSATTTTNGLAVPAPTLSTVTTT